VSSAERQPLENPPELGVQGLARYVADAQIPAESYGAAHACLLGALANALSALRRPECLRLAGPVVPGATMVHGARLPGTSIELDPVAAAFGLGVMLRWPDAADASVAGSWGHPGDCLGALLAAADYASRRAHHEARRPLIIHDLLGAMIKACEIQGMSAPGLDHLCRVRIASAAVVTSLLGGRGCDVERAIGNACAQAAASGADNGAAARGRWALGDATSRGLRMALLALAGESAGPPPAAAVPRPERPPAAHRMDGIGLCLGALSGPARPEARFDAAVGAHYGPRQSALIRARLAEPLRVARMPVHEFVAALVRNN